MYIWVEKQLDLSIHVCTHVREYKYNVYLRVKQSTGVIGMYIATLARRLCKPIAQSPSSGADKLRLSSRQRSTAANITLICASTFLSWKISLWSFNASLVM